MDLQFITHKTEKISYLESAILALKGGCKWIQLRMKDAQEEEIEEVALQLIPICKEYHSTFVIDDHVNLVKKLNTDGVHLGKNDMPISQARKILGENFIIGGTANTFEDILNHYKSGANYIGCGPFRYTTTKKNLSPILGIEGYKKIIESMKSSNLDIPIIAIGGITYDDIPSILGTGINGIALSGAILNAKDPIEETRKIILL